jgi:hypothetical protein
MGHLFPLLSLDQPSHVQGGSESEVHESDPEAGVFVNHKRQKQWRQDAGGIEIDQEQTGREK